MEFSTGETDISTVGEDTVRPTSRTAKTRSKGASAKKRQTKAVTMEKDDRGSEELVAGAAADAMAKAVAASVADTSDSKKVNPRRFAIVTDESRDANLTEFGKETLEDRYLLPGENYQDLFARVADAYADDQDHAQRLYDYISNLWFMPATPVLSNGGTHRGLPISCYLNSVEDSLNGIVDTWNENVWLASKGGGIGTYWGNVRGIGEPVGLNGKTSGII
ncbi:MAG: ribonucleotide-diphosphate reductase subunit alpha, partial [Citromicrobium sp.]|nr:ribonucleotide-diphosphate reductase subunit alpha [Citromicrobium sp.]